MKRIRHVWLLAAAILLIASGCAQKDGTSAQPPAANPPGSSQGPGAGENDIAPKPKDPDPEPAKVQKTVTLYFVDSDLMDMYRLNRDIVSDTEEGLLKEAFLAWIKGPEQEGLNNLVPPGVVVESVSGKDGVGTISFSKELKNANLGSSGEMFLIDQIALIMKQFGYDRTQILVEGKAEESLLGHVSTDKPVKSPDPEQYKWWPKK